jgi:hypothetical protein
MVAEGQFGAYVKNGFDRVAAKALQTKSRPTKAACLELTMIIEGERPRKGGGGSCTQEAFVEDSRQEGSANKSEGFYKGGT